MCCRASDSSNNAMISSSKKFLSSGPRLAITDETLIRAGIEQGDITQQRLSIQVAL